MRISVYLCEEFTVIFRHKGIKKLFLRVIHIHFFSFKQGTRHEFAWHPRAGAVLVPLCWSSCSPRAAEVSTTYSLSSVSQMFKVACAAQGQLPLHVRT